MAKPDPLDIAQRLHGGAIRLLRRVRVADAETGLSAPRLSALSVLAFGGAMSLTALARAEQVSLPTMSKLAAALEAAGLVAKRADRADKRGVRLDVTAKGTALMLEGRRRRLALLQRRLAKLSRDELEALDKAANLMLRIAAED